MTYEVHKLIHEAADACRASDGETHTHTYVAEEVLGMARNTHRNWRRRDLRERGDYLERNEDEARAAALRSFLGREAEGEGAPYAGPSDAETGEEDPLAAVEDLLAGVERGEEPDPGDLTDRERYIATKLQKGATIEGLVDDLGTRRSVALQHLEDLKRQGWKVYVDDTAEMVAIEGDHVLRSSEHKGTRTRKANRWWESRHNELVRRFRGLETPNADLAWSDGGEDWVTHQTDLHAGDKVRTDDGRVVYETAMIPDVIDYITDQSLRLARKHGSDYDTAHLLWGGDFVTGEAIYSGQFEDLDAWLDAQVETLATPLVRQVKAFARSPLFDVVQVVAKSGNHGENRASGTSRQANADLILYKLLRIVVAQLREHAGMLDNVNWRIGQVQPYRNFQMRGGRVKGHLRHGQHRRPQAETSARKKEWLATAWDHDPDVIYAGHYHVGGRVPWEGPPILFSGSPKPPASFVEKIGEKGVPTPHREVATAHGMSDDGLTSVFPIDTRYFDGYEL